MSEHTTKHDAQNAGDAHKNISAGRDADGQGELLLLALLEQLHSDRAADLGRELTTYCANNPELEDAFLDLALAADPAENMKETDTVGMAPRRLSPGVLRALASIPEFADGAELTDHTRLSRLVAEKRSGYHSKDQ